ncbi:Retrovirus-related Pol polyprotein from transposon TNT 1-94 [Stylophora pistillata]|uniref:Retrovirus-related Pol polyprotein from transposon TNT 1-94 n=1 Tax=Stylophora pistillata TaxID=50429 RepID=A0A2B4R677_STYPI|nr:Retrovirus-related Pol polyprotein from transposon TNT 1-94 [Stylophora pistillata]
MKDITDKLATIGAPISEEDQVVTSLGSLLRSFATLVTAIEARVDGVSLYYVQKTLIHEEMKQSVLSGQLNEAESALTRTFRRDTPRNRLTCFGCGAVGPVRPHCPSNSPRKQLTKGYRLFDETNRRMYIRRDAEFNENNFGQKRAMTTEPDPRYTLLCMYVKDALTIIGVHVDDLMILARNITEMRSVKDSLKLQFKMKDMGELYCYVRVCIVQDLINKQVFLHQGHYVEKMLQKFGKTKGKPISTTADLNVKLQKGHGFSRPVDLTLYLLILGSLLYATIATLPDIAQALGVVLKFCANPTQNHLTATKRIFRYLKATAYLGFSYKKCADEDLIGYSDADWVGDMDDHRGASGNVSSLACGAVSWLSKNQATVALSTTEDRVRSSQYGRSGSSLGSKVIGRHGRTSRGTN